MRRAERVPYLRGLLFEPHCQIMEAATQRAMKPISHFGVSFAIACLLGNAWILCVQAQSPPEISSVRRVAAREIALTVSGQPGTYYQLDSATNLFSWDGMATLAS